jgi:hypothetical protein
LDGILKEGRVVDGAGGVGGDMGHTQLRIGVSGGRVEHRGEREVKVFQKEERGGEDVKNPVKHNSIPKQEREGSALRLVLVARSPRNQTTKEKRSQMMEDRKSA